MAEVVHLGVHSIEDVRKMALVWSAVTDFPFSLGHDSSQAISLPRLIKKSEELTEDLELEKAKLSKLVDLVRRTLLQLILYVYYQYGY